MGIQGLLPLLKSVKAPYLCSADLSKGLPTSRCREKRGRKHLGSRRLTCKKLAFTSKLLMEENDRLQKQVLHLVYENGYMKHQLKSDVINFEVLLGHLTIDEHKLFLTFLLLTRFSYVEEVFDIGCIKENLLCFQQLL